jgi:hypothetical protein
VQCVVKNTGIQFIISGDSGMRLRVSVCYADARNGDKIEKFNDFGSDLLITVYLVGISVHDLERCHVPVTAPGQVSKKFFFECRLKLHLLYLLWICRKVVNLLYDLSYNKFTTNRVLVEFELQAYLFPIFTDSDSRVEYSAENMSLLRFNCYWQIISLCWTTLRVLTITQYFVFVSLIAYARGD